MKFNLKSFILGGIVGAMLFSIAPIYATVQQYILTKSEWKLVNGDGAVYADKDYPALMMNGSNYVPVGKIAQFLGVDFVVDGKTKTAIFKTHVDVEKNASTSDISSSNTVKVLNIGDTFTWSGSAYNGKGYSITLKSVTPPDHPNYQGFYFYGFDFDIHNETGESVLDLGKLGIEYVDDKGNVKIRTTVFHSNNPFSPELKNERISIQAAGGLINYKKVNALVYTDNTNNQQVRWQIVE